MSNSTHQVEVVPIIMEKHPNADSLSIVNVFGGYTCIVRTEDWKGVALGAYLPPDSVVDTARPEFSFLAEKAKVDGTHRVKAIKLRKVVSYGLMVPAPAGTKVGDDVAQLLGVTHYEPPIPGVQNSGLITGGEVAKGPDVYTIKYDVDAFRKYHHLFVEGEQVWVTEKIHGCSARYVYHNDQMYCGSRNEWKKEFPSYDHITLDYLRANVFKKDVEPKEVDEERVQEIFDRLHNKPKPRNLWWNALDATPVLESWCKANPGCTVYGEVFGQVQTLKYGVQGFAFAAFDIMVNSIFLDPVHARDFGNALPWVPILANAVPYSFAMVVSHSDGPSTWPGAKHYREGCVVKPLIERTDMHVGRVCFKCVGATYLEKD
jgi:RNA ligase (TIGR02306 family)